MRFPSHLERLAVLTVLLLSLGVASTAEGATRFAAPKGNGPAGTCPKSNPCDIQTAVEAAAVDDGDEVSLEGGTYGTGSDVLEVVKGIAVHGTPGRLPPRILSTDAEFAVRLDNPEARLRDVEILQDGGTAGLALLEGTAERITVTSTAPTSAAACTALGEAVLRDSVCLGTDGAAGFAVIASGIFDLKPKLRNVTAVASGPGSSSYGIRMVIGGGGVATLDAINVIASGSAGDVLAETDGLPGSTAAVELDHSNFESTQLVGTGSSITSPASSDNQTTAPRFVDEAKADFHQQPDSPTIDGGVTDPLIGETDIDGELRVLGAAPDIGADESDTEVIGPKVKAKDVQRQHGSTVRVDLKAGAKEPVTVHAKGTVTAGAKTFDLEKASIKVREKPKALQLQLGKSDARPIKGALEDGDVVEAEIVVTLVDDAGNTARVKRSVRLK